MTLRDDDRETMIRLYMEKARDSLKDSEVEETSPSARVNRAYYSAFYCASALLLTKNIEGNSHKAILSEFGREFIKTGEFPNDLGVALRELEKKRYTADYSLKMVTTKEKAEDSCRKARSFYESSKRILEVFI